MEAIQCRASCFAQLAQIYLAVQASSALSERVFVKASLLLSNCRTAMDPTIAEKNLFVSENWHHWNNVDLLKAVHEKEDKEEEEG